MLVSFTPADISRSSKRRLRLPGILSSWAAFALLVTVGCREKKESVAAAAAPPSAAPALNLAPTPAPVPAPADVASPPADAERTPSGVAMKVLEPGSGSRHPEADRILTMSYVGWRKDGVMFDQSPPVELMYRQLTPGWAEGVGYMLEGEKRRLWIPAALAFGDAPQAGLPKGDITMDVKLVSIGKKGGSPAPAANASAAVPAPEDVAAVPKTAKKTTSGLSYRILTSANGPQPTASDTVLAQYTGWTPDGKMFDSSVTRGKPGRFALNHVIPGWTEGLQLMHVGEKARFWIPPALAYGDKPARPGAPAGPLVFDIELVGIEPVRAPAP